MIFSRFFTPAHASKNQQTREKAVVSLSPDNPDHRRILHELAFNDESGEVSLAALRQLNSFVLWQKMTEIARDANVRRQANAWVENAILNGGSDITLAEKVAFLVESASTPLQAKALYSDLLNQLPAETVIVLLKKVQQADVNIHVYANTNSFEVRGAIVAMTDEQRVLNRLLKQAQEGERQQIEAKLEALIAQQQRPVEIEQATTMVLSKLQALLDKNQPDLVEKKQRLQREYTTLVDEFSLLTSEVQAKFVDKYTNIQQRLDRHIERLQPEWAEQLAIQARTEQIAAAVGQLNQCKQSASQLLAQEQFADSDIESAAQAIDQAIASGNKLSDPEVARLCADLAVLQRRLKSRRGDESLAAEIVRKLDDIQITDEALVHDSMPAVQQVIEEVGELVKQAHYLPDNVLLRIKDAKRHSVKLRQQIKQQANQKFSQCRKLIGVIKSLLDSGKYRPALLRFGQLSTQYEALDEHAQQRLSKQYLGVKEQVERLSDWQSFLANDKQPELLTAAQELAAQTPSNIEQRIRAVKDLRQQWQSLLTPGETDSAKLNEQFDSLLEQAFEPCRKHFAELEARKLQAVERRHGIIEQAKKLSQLDDMKALDKALTKLREAWQNAGHVDANLFAELNSQWLASTQTVLTRLNEWYEHNRSQKEQLLRSAQQLLAADHSGRGHEAKALQRKWKDIGFAGRNVDSKLWRAFRKANDDLFEQLDSLRQAQREQTNKNIAEVSAIGEAILAKVDSSDIDVSELSAEYDRFIAQLNALDVHKSAQLKRLSGDILRKLQHLRNEQHAQQRARSLASMTELLTQWSDQDSAGQVAKLDGFAAIPRTWQKAITDASPQQVDLSREQLLIKLEIALQLPTPAEFETQRSEIQLTMLADRLGGGDSVDAENLWQQYLACGAIPKEQLTKELLRVEPIITALLNRK